MRRPLDRHARYTAEAYDDEIELDIAGDDGGWLGCGHPSGITLTRADLLAMLAMLPTNADAPRDGGASSAEHGARPGCPGQRTALSGDARARAMAEDRALAVLRASLDAGKSHIFDVARALSDAGLLRLPDDAAAIERAARALYVIDGYEPGMWDGETSGIQGRYRSRARVALAAAEGTDG
jgi:hypothetical protein